MANSVFSQEGIISGSISSPINLRGRVLITVDREFYSGNCYITPKIDSQILPTCDKVMTEDITVEGIPIYETSNPQGGNTIIIGG